MNSGCSAALGHCWFDGEQRCVGTRFLEGTVCCLSDFLRCVYDAVLGACVRTCALCLRATRDPEVQVWTRRRAVRANGLLSRDVTSFEVR